MTVLQGGRMAEAIVFGSITTGAADDLKRVAEIARSMVDEYAMGTGMASQRVGGDDGLSEMTRRARDREQADLADEAQRAARDIILSHRGQLDQLAESLLSNEVLVRKDIDRIMGKGDVRRLPVGDRLIASASDEDPTAPAH